MLYYSANLLICQIFVANAKKPDTFVSGRRGLGGASAAAVTAAIAAVIVADEQQNDDDKEQPTAIGLAAEQITQTHIDTLLFQNDSRGSAAAAATAARGNVAGVAASVALVKNENDCDNEQQPGAIHVAAEQIAQTHTFILLSESPVGAFIVILCGQNHLVIKN